MKTGPRWVIVFGVIALLLGGARGVRAQTALTISGGAAPYDLSGTGTSGIAALRMDLAVSAQVNVQLGSAFFWYRSQGDRSVAMVIPAVGVVVEVPKAPVYVGAGAGYTLGVRGDPPNDPVLYGAIGAEMGDRGRWTIRPELRVHAIDPWTGSIAEFALGLRRSFGHP